ncbi:hypothetical protein LXL04_032348 [Taraxacum kok-saghyz]
MKKGNNLILNIELKGLWSNVPHGTNPAPTHFHTDLQLVLSSSLPVSSDFDFSHRLLRFTRNRLSSSLLDLFSPPVLHFITSRCSAPSQLHLPAINSDLHPSASDAVGSILASDAASTSAALHALHFLKVVYFPVLGKVVWQVIPSSAGSDASGFNNPHGVCGFESFYDSVNPSHLKPLVW